MTVYKDKFGNRATIEETMLYPFKGSKQKEKAFVLSVYADYDNEFMYFRSIYETLNDAENKLKKMSCGTFELN